MCTSHRPWLHVHGPVTTMVFTGLSNFVWIFGSGFSWLIGGLLDVGGFWLDLVYGRVVKGECSFWEKAVGEEGYRFGKNCDRDLVIWGLGDMFIWEALGRIFIGLTCANQLSGWALTILSIIGMSYYWNLDNKVMQDNVCLCKFGIKSL